MVEHSHVSIHVVEVVRVRRVVLFRPVDRKWTVQVKDVVLWFRLIIDTVKAHHLGQRVTAMIYGPQ